MTRLIILVDSRREIRRGSCLGWMRVSGNVSWEFDAEYVWAAGLRRVGGN